MGDLRSAFSINSCRFWIQKTMMIFLKGKQRESLPRNVAYVILTSFKSATFASTSRDWLKPQPQQQHQQQEQGAKQTKTEDCDCKWYNKIPCLGNTMQLIKYPNFCLTCHFHTTRNDDLPHPGQAGLHAGTQFLSSSPVLRLF